MTTAPLDNTAWRECDHTRGAGRMRNTAITVCRNCRDYMCSICGFTIDWHEGLFVTNPPVQWRYCMKPACVEVEAAYHALTVDEMWQRRNELRAKRWLENVRSQRPFNLADAKARVVADGGTWEGGGGRPERITLGPSTFKLDPGEACWCNLGKDCSGSHEIGPIVVVNICGRCGRTFRIAKDDPHWVTGRGPCCPTEKT
jgi:hypothetical protein